MAASGPGPGPAAQPGTGSLPGPVERPDAEVDGGARAPSARPCAVAARGCAERKRGFLTRFPGIGRALRQDPDFRVNNILIAGFSGVIRSIRPPEGMPDVPNYWYSSHGSHSFGAFGHVVGLSICACRGLSPTRSPNAPHQDWNYPKELE